MQRIPGWIVGGLAACWALGASGQTPMQDVIRAQADEVAVCTKTQDYAKLADITYPKLVEMAGGREGFIAYTKRLMTQVKAAGYKVDTFDLGTASEPVAGGDKLFAYVPDTVSVSGPKGKIEQNCYLLAVSTDKGKTWTFIDSTGLTTALLNQFFPDFPASLKLPQNTTPKVVPDS